MLMERLQRMLPALQSREQSKASEQYAANRLATADSPAW
ncbi:hypothetical protein LEMLEM_LOCUS24888 [Lemmus lemmus]